MSLPIAQAATAISFFEKTQIHRSQARIMPSDALMQMPGGHMFRAVGATTTVRNFKLENVLLEANTGLLFKDRHVIPETSCFAPEGAVRDLDAPPTNVVELVDGEDFVFGYNNAHGAYQHWMTQCVPAIDWSLRQPRKRGVRLVLPALKPWQEEIVHTLGYSDVPRLTLKPDTFYRLPHAEYSEFLNGRTSFSISLTARDTLRRILDRLPPTRSSVFEPVIFIPCSNPYYGALRNEDEITDMLRQRGVCILSSHLGLAERIDHFCNAEVVIGPHGQDLTDVIFCKPGALLWEWMPGRHQNASFNRLAQAADLDYWGDVFESDDDPIRPGLWSVDGQVVSRGLSKISERLARRAGPNASPPAGETPRYATGKSLDDLMLAFESLGDNCEFGLIQRLAGIEPLGLLRFANLHLTKLVEGLNTEFIGLGNEGTVTVYPSGVSGRREFMVKESSYGMLYHSGVLEGDVEPSVQLAREYARLRFLRRKLLEDLLTGEKIWVWRALSVTDRTQVEPLLAALRARGPNTLLWVVAADDDHPSGAVERLEPDFLKGYVERLATYENATDIAPVPWFNVCETAYKLCHPDEPSPDEPKPKGHS